MTTVAVVGAGGYIGRHVVTHLRALGIRVIAMSSRDGTGLDPYTGLLPTDYAFDETVDGVIYAAQSPQYRNIPAGAWHLLAVNSAAPVQVAVAAVKAGAKNFIYLSTGNVYRPSFAPLKEADEVLGTHWYPFSKIQGEQALKFLKINLQTTIVRVFAVYGADQSDKLIPNLIESIETEKPIVLAPRHVGSPDGGLRINPCYIDDAADVISKLACFGGPEVINLAGPEIVNIQRIASLWAELSGKQPVIAEAADVRLMDLVADTTTLSSYIGRPLKSFGEGLSQVAIGRNVSLNALPAAH